MIHKFFTITLVMGVMFCSAVISTRLIADNVQQSSEVVVPIAHEVSVQNENEQAELLKKIWEIQNLKTTIDMREQLRTETTEYNGDAPFTDQVGKAVTAGFGDGVKFVKATTAKSIRFLVKVGVAVMILGFGSTFAYRVIASGEVDPIELSARATWYLFGVGSRVAGYVAKKVLPGDKK